MVGVLGGRAMAAATSSLVGTDGAASAPRLAWPSSCAASRPGGRTSPTHSDGRATRSCAPYARHRPNAIRRSGRQSSRRGERIPLLRDGWTESGSEWLGTLRYDDGAATLRALGRVCCS